MELTPKAAAARVRRLGGVIEREAVRAMNRALDDALDDARQMSSGFFSRRELAKRDHPYARRHPAPLLPPEIINAQSGEFREKWRIDRVISPFDGGALVNDAPHADFLQFGTRWMHMRPIAVVLVVKLADHAEKRLNEAGTRLGKRYA